MEQNPKNKKENSIHLKQNNLLENNNYFYNNNIYRNLQYFCYKILEAKHSSTPEIYLQILLNNLIIKKKGHLLAYINEMAINTNILKELLKRFYYKEESKNRIPKYASYYQNYLKFFCRPLFSDYYTNKKMVKHMEKVAQIFYNENYVDDEGVEDSNRYKKVNFKIFTKAVIEDIENCDKFTIVKHTETNDRSKIIIPMNNKNNIKNRNDAKSKTINININNKLSSNNNDLDLLEKIYKLTPIYDNIKKNKLEEECKKTELNSYKLIIKELDHKKKVKCKESANKKINNNNNKILTHYCNIFDYFKSLSGLLFGKRKNRLLYKNNSINIKHFKKKDKKKFENYDSNNNKVINNINININQLTIGQKQLNPVSESYNNTLYKKGKRSMIRKRKNNSMILRDRSSKNPFGNLTSKNFENKKRINSFKLIQPINGIIGYNSSKNRKIPNINSNSNISNTRNKSNLRGGSAGRINNGCITSLHKYNKNNKKSKNFGKMTIYTNNNNNIKNICINSKKIKNSSSNNSGIINFNNSNNYNSNNHNNISCLYKNSSLSLMSPYFWHRRHKNNISLKKGISIISYEKIRSTSNKSKKKKKAFSPGSNISNMSSFNMLLINGSHNFISPKNTLISNLSRSKYNRNEISHDNKDSFSRIFPEGIPVINKYSSILNKKNLKDEQIYRKANIINMKFKNLLKYSKIKNTLKAIPKKLSKGKNSLKKNK